MLPVFFVIYSNGFLYNVFDAPADLVLDLEFGTNNGLVRFEFGKTHDRV